MKKFTLILLETYSRKFIPKHVVLFWNIVIRRFPKKWLCPKCYSSSWGNVNFNWDGSPYEYCAECGYAPDYKDKKDVTNESSRY